MYSALFKDQLCNGFLQMADCGFHLSFTQRLSKHKKNAPQLQVSIGHSYKVCLNTKTFALLCTARC